MPHFAEHRALRELHFFGRQLTSHWERLGRRLGGPEAGLLAAGAADARALLTEAGALMAARDVPADRAAARGDEELRALCAAGEERLARHERPLRDAIVTLGTRPDEAIAPAVPSAAGRVGQRVAAGAGAFGEWVDRRAI